MVLKPALKAEAELEASRIRRMRATTTPPPLLSAVFVTCIRRTGRRTFGSPCTIFFARISIVDAIGHAMEQLLVPIKIERRDAFRSSWRGLLDRYRKDIEATA